MPLGSKFDNEKKGPCKYFAGTCTKISKQTSDIWTFFTLQANNKSHASSYQNAEKEKKEKYSNCCWLKLLLSIKVVGKFCLVKISPYCFSRPGKSTRRTARSPRLPVKAYYIPASDKVLNARCQNSSIQTFGNTPIYFCVLQLPIEDLPFKKKFFHL